MTFENLAPAYLGPLPARSEHRAARAALSIHRSSRHAAALAVAAGSTRPEGPSATQTAFNVIIAIQPNLV